MLQELLTETNTYYLYYIFFRYKKYLLSRDKIKKCIIFQKKRFEIIKKSVNNIIIL